MMDSMVKGAGASEYLLAPIHGFRSFGMQHGAYGIVKRR